MKSVPSFLLFAVSLSITTELGAQSVNVLERGPHDAVIQTILPDGTTNTFTHLQTGLNRWSAADNQFVPASGEVELVNGVPLARKTQYQVIFGTTLDAPEGAADVLMLDGRRIRVRPVGIAYTEFNAGQPGRSVFVAETNAASSEITGRSEVTYANALSGGVSASVRFRVSISGLEQDVVLASALPPPSEFQMNEALVRAEVWNEILESPAPEKQTANIVRSDGSVDRDEQLSFDVMLFGSGNVFDGAGKSIRVARQWQEIDGKVFLIESVPYSELKPLLASLPADSQGRSIDAEKLRELWAKQSDRGRSLPVGGVVRSETRVARATAPSSREAEVVWDWTLLATATNTVLKGDTSYYVNGPVTLSATTNGATVIEGACVVKFTNSTAAQIVINGPISCQTSAFRPAVFSSKDDNSVGETITGSTGSPANYYGDGLKVDGNTLTNLRFSYANRAISVNNNQNLNLSDCQFVRCLHPLYAYYQNALNLENVLCYVADALVQNGPVTLRAAHLTFDQGNLVGSGLVEPSEVFLTNSILFAVTNWGFVSTNRHPEPDNVVTPNSFGVSGDRSPFQTVAAGSHYLSYDTSFRDAGTTNLNAALLERLTRKTTYPPCVLVSDFTVNTALGPRDIRDANTRDLGFEYDPLDYLWTSLNITNNSTLTLTNGVAVGSYGPRLIWLRGSSKLVSEGTPINLNRLVTFHTVQEQPLALITNTALMTLINGVDVALRFTDVSVMAAASSGRRLIPTGPFNSTVTVRDSQLRGVYWYFYNFSTSGQTTPTIHLTNSLLERCTIDWTQGYDIIPFDPYYLYLALYNNLFTRCSVTLRHYGSYYGSWDIYDNLFDNGSVTKSEYGQGKPNGSSLTTVGYNGFINTSNPFGGSGNKTGLLRDFQKSVLGDYYYPTNSITNSLSTLVNVGSRTASSAGLTSYTTITNQTLDSGTVDIGYHFLGVNTTNTVTISATDTNAVEGATPSDPGIFTVSRTGSTAAALTVFYSVGGSAANGVDYSTLAGSVIIGSGQPSASIQVQPIDDGLPEVPESVTLSLILTNTYFVGTPDHASLTIQDDDDLSAPGSVATVNGPIGIDYHGPQNALIVSFNYPTSQPKDFLKIAANGITNAWSTLAGVGVNSNEIKLATVKTTANGWTNGDLFYGTRVAGQIGWLSADGTTFNTNWLTLSGETNLLQGSLYLDQTGVFGGDLIVVTGGDPNDPDAARFGGGVWRITASKSATKVAQINEDDGTTGRLLEGVTTVPNDPCKYGPWAGKIVTCAEQAGLIYAIDLNGNATSYQFNIAVPEDVDLVPADQNLFCLNFVNSAPSTSTVLKVPKTVLANFVGDVLIVEENLADLVVVHWDGVKFVMRRLFLSGAAQLEHVSFAPIEAQ